MTTNLVFFFAEKNFNIAEWTGVSSNLNLLIHRPWTIATYMFVHADIIHIIINLLVFYWFGKIFLTYLSQRQLLGVYILGGLVGAIFFIITYNIIPIFTEVKYTAYAVGASASIMAIVFACATLVPNLQVRLAFIANVKLKYLALIIVLLDLLCIPLSNAGGHIAHLGGAFFGFTYIKLLRHNTDLCSFISYFEKIFAKKRNTQKKVFFSTDKKQQKKIDDILDKISKSGYTSLSSEEKEILFKNSKN